MRVIRFKPERAVFIIPLVKKKLATLKRLPEPARIARRKVAIKKRLQRQKKARRMRMRR